MEPPQTLTLANATATWQQAAGSVEAFVAAWNASPEPPPLAQFVPAGPPALRWLLLLELIKVDLEQRWSRGKSPLRIEDYQRMFPELGQAGVPSDLLYEEYQQRHKAGDKVSVDEYRQRFPAQAADMARLVGSAAPPQPVGLCGRVRLEGLQPGTQIDDFNLLLVLGEGAFARVYLALQRSMQRLVALKVSAARGNEPQTLAQLDHPHIVRVFDRRLLPERGLSLMYMQYAPGGTLQAVLPLLHGTPDTSPEQKRRDHPGAGASGLCQRTGRILLQAVDQALARRGEVPPVDSTLRQRLAGLPWPETVCWLGTRLATALAHAHRRGVLHRDLKPANVLLTAEGSPRLADFNVGFSSKLEGDSAAAFFGGTLAYMSPEQLEVFDRDSPRQAESLDGRSDLYSLAVVLWELLTGERPFTDEPLPQDLNAMMQQVRANRQKGVPPAAIAQLPADCPEGLQEVLLTCLNPEPDQRCATGDQLAGQLQLCQNPQARQLFHPPRHGWRNVVRRWPILSLLLLALLPNVAMAKFNYDYNLQEIINYLLPGSKPTFWAIQLVINAVAFPVGIGLFLRVLVPAQRDFARVRSQERCKPEERSAARHRCLLLGHRFAEICLVCWLLGGLAYPICLVALLNEMPLWAQLHFFVSLALCGLISAVYPFLGITFLCVRALYPTLTEPETATQADQAELARVEWWAWIYLGLAAAVPLLALTALAVFRHASPVIMGILGVGGLVGFGLAFWLFQLIQQDLRTLATVLQPMSEALE